MHRDDQKTDQGKMVLGKGEGTDEGEELDEIEAAEESEEKRKGKEVAEEVAKDVTGGAAIEVKELEEVDVPEEPEELEDLEEEGDHAGDEEGTAAVAEVLDFAVGPEEAGRRLDLFLVGREPRFSRSYIQRLVEEGRVQLNEGPAKAGLRLKVGDRVRIKVPPPVKLEVAPEPIPLDIVYEDADIIVVNKARGMVVHPGAGNFSGTLVNALLAHCQDLAGINDVLRPGIVHRLDKDTTGLLVVAKNDLAYRGLAKQIKERSLKREYLALVEGSIPVEQGVIDAPIGRHPRYRQKMAVVKDGRPARTHFRVLKRFPRYTYLALRLETGRTHQIRVHLSYFGYPVVADPLYGKPSNPFGLTGQALHAATLGLLHPRSGRYLEFSAPLPADFKQALLFLQAE